MIKKGEEFVQMSSNDMKIIYKYPKRYTVRNITVENITLGNITWMSNLF